MKLFRWGTGDAAALLPPCKLRASALAAQLRCGGGGGADVGGAADDAAGDGSLLATAGVPAAADGCAYEPTQRLLAVSTADGRVKVFGGGGESERTLRSGLPPLLAASDDGGGAAGRAPSAGLDRAVSAASSSGLGGFTDLGGGGGGGFGGFGGDGATGSAGTRQLLFLRDRGAVVRVDTVCARAALFCVCRRKGERGVVSRAG